MIFYQLHIIDPNTDKCLMTLDAKTRGDADIDEAIYKELGYKVEVVENSDAPLFQVIGEEWEEHPEDRRY